MKILVLGTGGREHALVWALAASPGVETIDCIPGNPGISSIARCHALSLSDHRGIAAFARENAIDLVVVGPEAPLAEGLADTLEAGGINVFGPSRRAAELEWSKSFAKDFMARHLIPTAGYRIFDASALDDAREYLSVCPLPVVLKADGLAAGKGVLISGSREEAFAGLVSIAEAKMFGHAGDRLVVEEFLEGEEASVFAVTDGARYVMLAPAQDHKRALDGDQGKNTGGMGAYAPAPCVDSVVMDRVRKDIIAPVLQGMHAEGREYRGCLYVGLMLTADGPRVVEFNCRFGDPETQVVLPLYPGNFARLLLDAATGELSAEVLASAALPMQGAAACVVLASQGYPDHYPTGIPVHGLDRASSRRDTVVFQAGTKEAGGTVVTSGGRVLAVTGIDRSGSIACAVARAYEAVGDIQFEGMHYRHDIAHRALQSKRGKV